MILLLNENNHSTGKIEGSLLFLDMPTKEEKREKAREVVDILEEISILLVSLHCQSVAFHLCLTFMMQNTQLDRAQLSLCVSLIENGVNPEALAVCTIWAHRSNAADTV